MVTWAAPNAVLGPRIGRLTEWEQNCSMSCIPQVLDSLSHCLSGAGWVEAARCAVIQLAACTIAAGGVKCKNKVG
jgi:hypothetical protein